jgi:hypothetical protein
MCARAGAKKGSRVKKEEAEVGIVLAGGFICFADIDHHCP